MDFFWPLAEITDEFEYEILIHNPHGDCIGVVCFILLPGLFSHFSDLVALAWAWNGFESNHRAQFAGTVIAYTVSAQA